MAAALVNDGAIRAELFNNCNGEQSAFFQNWSHFLPEIRKAHGPQFAAKIEKLIDATSDGRKKTATSRERMKAMRETMEKEQAQTA